MSAESDIAGAAGGLGLHLFTFAVIADTHVNQVEGEASSDFAVNKLANARNRHIIHSINQAAPAFVLHLGDIVHPTPIHPAYATAAAVYRALAAELDCPIYLTPGNHDVGDKPGDWLPVPSVNDAFLRMYHEQFGKNFFSFDSHGCHFVIVDAQIINSGLPAEAQQRTWLEQDLAAHAAGRVFLCTHYPPYLYADDEHGHYDNIDEPGRAWLLGLTRKHRVEAVFAGHVHNFWYHHDHDTDIYLLPSTAFVRLDYSEMFRVEAAPERGRNDAPKLGHMLVHVHEHGHVAQILRSNGQVLGPGQTLDAGVRHLPPTHSRSLVHAPLGIDLRYPWAETVAVAASGALDEFDRKRARNDYPLLALWEMGIRQLRVPLSDLQDAASVRRMASLTRLGHRFSVYTLGVPDGVRWAALAEHAHLLEAWEIVASRNQIEALPLAQLHALKKRGGLRLILSKLQRHDDAQHHGNKSRHVIQQGFTLADAAEVTALADRPALRAVFDGLLFNTGTSASLTAEVAGIAALMRRLGWQARADVRLASDTPSIAMEDERVNTGRVAQIVLTAFAQRDVELFLDTLADVDRGYFPRAGLVDRRYNPRAAGRVCAHLHSALNTVPGLDAPTELQAQEYGPASALAFKAGSARWLLLLPRAVTEGPPLPPTEQCIDLLDGRIHDTPPATPLAAPMLWRLASTVRNPSSA